MPSPSANRGGRCAQKVSTYRPMVTSTTIVNQGTTVGAYEYIP
jgi:hypothetical protein